MCSLYLQPEIADQVDVFVGLTLIAVELGVLVHLFHPTDHYGTKTLKIAQ